MSDNEKIYLQKGEVTVSASRVILGDKNFVLRNISSVQVFTQPLKKGGYVLCGVWALCGILVGILFEYVLLMAVIIIGSLLFLLIKDKHFVQVSSGGTPTNTICSNAIEFPQKVVEAINNALLDLDKNRASSAGKEESVVGSSAAEEMKEMKELLDSDIITQDDYDAKKKELLGI